ncbi:MAG: PQQ-binding-like beta-propeller repeat protein, partial [Planctomycetales bacterium]
MFSKYAFVFCLLIALSSMPLATEGRSDTAAIGPAASWQFTNEHLQDGAFRPLAGQWNIHAQGDSRFADDPPQAMLLTSEPDRPLGTAEQPDTWLPQGGLTVEAWVKIDKPIEWGGIVGAFKDGSDEKGGWLLGYNANQFFFALASERQPDISYLSASQFYQAGYWYHVVGTYDQSQQKIYIDGILRAQATDPSGGIRYPKATSLQLGTFRDQAKSNQLEGQIESLSIWDRALSTSEIRRRFDDRKSQFPGVLPIDFKTEDWPTYGRDNWRSAHANAELKLPLQLRWRRTMLHPPQPTWPPPAKQDFWHGQKNLQPRVSHDRCFHPVCVGDQVFIGSSSDDQLRCLDADTGKLIWDFFAEAPIRIAPTVVENKVLFGSDDGYVYCLNSADGKLVWKYRDQNASRWIPGNGRLINAKPIRCSIFVEGEVAYVCAGLWPSQGVQLVALDIRNGKPMGSATLPISPQGYLKRRAGRLFAPTGRAQTGAMITTLRRQGKDPVVEKFTVPAGFNHVVIGAGEMRFGGGNGKLAAFDSLSGQMVWQTKIEGTVGSLAIARERLLVSTEEGDLYCFTAEADAVADTLTTAVADPYPHQDRSGYQALAEDIIKRGKVTQGYCLLLGCGNGQLAYELAKQTELKIVAIDTDTARVQQVRRRLHEAGVYGKVTVHLIDNLDRLPYTDYVFNLVIRDKLANNPIEVPAAEIRRLVRPFGGTTMFIEDDMSVTRRGPLPGIGEWTHIYANPANTSCSTDKVVGSKFALQWFGRPGPQSMVDRHHRTVPPLWKSGRLYVPGDNRVIAVDAYNGTILWNVEVPNSRRVGVMRDCGSMAATEEGLYIAAGSKCRFLDATTGQIQHEFPVPKANDGNATQWGYTACHGQLLFGSSVEEGATRRDHSKSAIQGFYWDFRPIVSSVGLFAVDRFDGKVKWNYAPSGHALLNPTITLGDGKFYFVEVAVKDGRQQKGTPGRVRINEALKKPAT